MMHRTAAVALRPGSIFRAFNRVWKVTANDTLNRKLSVREYKGRDTKVFNYKADKLITCLHVPFSQI